MMYDYLTSLITKELKKANKIVTTRRVDEVYLSLVYILFLSSKKEHKGKIKELLEQNNIKLFLDYLNKEHNYHCLYLKYIDIKQFLKVIKTQNYKELVEEFLKEKEDPEFIRLEIFKKTNDKILYLNTNDTFNSYNYTDKNPSYLQESLNSIYYSDYVFYKALDEMLKIKRNYYHKFKEINIDEYDTVIINDIEPLYKYITNKDDLIQDIEKKFSDFKGKIILKTNYNKISRFKNYYLLKRLSKVILHAYVKNNTVYMEFLPSNNNNISLILLNDELANDNSKLKKIIENNRNKKDTLIKVTPEDIRNNNYRISFKMYNTENIEKVKAINDIVDENTELIKTLERINNVIEAEVNKLLERTGG